MPYVPPSWLAIHTFAAAATKKAWMVGTSSAMSVPRTGGQSYVSPYGA
jgi:hypothetical protein